jgi:hypothetical protein
MKKRHSKMALPRAVDDALEQLMLDDRAWFDAHPDRRLRRRLMHWSEQRSNALVSLMTGQPVQSDALEVVVVRAPHTSGMRVRLFLPPDPVQHAWFEEHAALLASLQTPEEFARRASAGYALGDVG